MLSLGAKTTMTIGMVAFFILIHGGCARKKFETRPVRGVVKFEDGSLVSSGRVEFFSKESELSARGEIQSDGTFVMGTETIDDGAVTGEHQVIIVQIIGPADSGMVTHDHGAHIDRRFSSFASSGLTFTVEDRQENLAEFVVSQGD